MIEYSIYMMGNPIKPEEPQKAYAKNQVREIWDLNKFCKHIASHNAGYSRGMVKAILSDMCDCIVEQLLNGNKIKLGEFGVFSISINCEGCGVAGEVYRGEHQVGEHQVQPWCGL